MVLKFGRFVLMLLFVLIRMMCRVVRYCVCEFGVILVLFRNWLLKVLLVEVRVFLKVIVEVLSVMCRLCVLRV